MNALKRQWQGYPLYHESRFNLAVHVVAVPAFLAGNVFLVACLGAGDWVGSIASLGVMAAAIAAQRRGHKAESNPAIPFPDQSMP